jgi:hypothetical protein
MKRKLLHKNDSATLLLMNLVFHFFLLTLPTIKTYFSIISKTLTSLLFNILIEYQFFLNNSFFQMNNYQSTKNQKMDFKKDIILVISEDIQGEN